MKTKITINIRVPRSWAECTHRQYRWLLRTLASQQQMLTIELKTLAFIRFSGIRILSHTQDLTSFLLQKDKLIFDVDPETFSRWLTHVDWLLYPPTRPWRPHRLAWGRTKDTTLQDVDFDTYLQLENLYQGFLHTTDTGLLLQMARLLVPRRWRPFRQWELLAVFNWYASIKEHFSRLYPHFLIPAAASGNPDGSTSGTGLYGGACEGGSSNIHTRLRQAVDAQIRALTKGDITREAEILSMPCHRALTELNAQAREYQELQAKTKK